MSTDVLKKLKRSAVKGKAPNLNQIAAGELALNTNDGRMFFKTVDSSSVETLHTLREVLEDNLIIDPSGLSYAAGTTLDAVLDNLDSAIGKAYAQTVTTNASIDGDGVGTPLSISASGVTAATYGSATQVPVFSVTADGRIDSATYRTVAGITAFTYDSATQILNIGTADGGSFNALIDLSTTQVQEGTNLYYTTARADSAFDVRIATKSTSDVSEGTNLYYTTARADSDAKNSISVNDAGGDGSLAYNAATGIITYTGPSAAETRAHISGGTGVTITNGSIAIAQSVATNADVTFGKVTSDSSQIGALHLTKKAVAPNSQAGLLFFDSDPQSGLSFIPTTNENVQDVTINIGQEVLIYVHNLTGAQIDNGDAVYISGTAHGVHPQVAKARANDATTSVPIGVATMNIPNNAHGYVTKVGLVRGLNTTGMTEGATAYLSKDSAGKWSDTEVSVDSGYPTLLGTIISVDGTEGSLLVNVDRESYESLNVQNRVVVGTSLSVPSISGRSITFDGQTPTSTPEGTVYYSASDGALVVKNDEAEISLQVGQEEWIRVYNNSGASITNGTPVYLSGQNNNIPTIEEADADNAFGATGLATHTIENASIGYVTTRGLVNDIDTSGLTAGQRVHVASTGGLQTDAPQFPFYPTDMGICLVSDSAGGGGTMYVNVIDHTYETIRVTQDAHFGANITVTGDLNVLGTTTQVRTQTLETGGNLLKLLDGDTLGTAYQNTGGLNDATFKGKYTGDSAAFWFVRMSSVDSAGVGDAIEWGISDSDLMSYGSYNGTYGYGKSFDSDASGKTVWNLLTDGLTAPLRDDVSIQLVSVSGHDSADFWCAHPTELNLDLGLVGNYNEANEPLRYAGVVRDATDSRWKFFDGYPGVGIDSAAVDINFDSASLSNIQFGTAFGNLSGNATSATTAVTLANARTIGINGDITGTATSFNGGASITIASNITAGAIVNADINASAAIADSKLGTISTSGKVNNSATTATAANTGSAIVARNASGNFSANVITANLDGRADSASNASHLEGEGAAHYRINVYNSSGTLLN